MLRRSPLKRKTRLRPKRKTQRRSGRVRNPEYMAWVRTLPCLLEGGECEGRIHAHHAGRRAAGRKADDDTCIPLCAYHHAALHSKSGPFEEMTSTRNWQDIMVRAVQSFRRVAS